ncbi:MAG: hypothetical protein F9K44_02880 [Hyphomicrobiaceae bacterium]|nr:MAG: hypothetical protein F9K44_02880 [Hyphomicrobiaceae bacterium]
MMWSLVRRVVVLSLSLCLAGQDWGAIAAQPEKRVALVIGNSAYRHSPTLKNPGNDAAAVTNTLKSLGFTVISGIDLNFGSLATTVRDFSRELDGASVALFYYAGHGLQVAGVNYLVPVDAKLAQEIDLSFETLQLDAVLSLMGRVKGTKIVLLDACRDNPLAASLARSLPSSRNIGIGKGLANMRAEPGMFIAFATEPGNVAFDGDGKHSPFTEALLKHLPTPDTDLQSMMRRVRADVIQSTGRRQTPWESSSLTSAFLFKETPKPPPLPTPVALPKPEPPKPPEVPQISKEQQMLLAWQAAQAIGTCGSYERFRKAYPHTVFAGLAEEWMRTRCKDGKPIETAVTPMPAPPSVAKIPNAAIEPPRDPAASTPTAPKTVAVPPTPPKAIEPEPKPEPKQTKVKEVDEEERLSRSRSRSNKETAETRSRPSVKEDSGENAKNRNPNECVSNPQAKAAFFWKKYCD